MLQQLSNLEAGAAERQIRGDVMLLLLADLGANIRTWGFADFLIAVVIFAACVGLAVIAMRVFEVTIPPWLVQVFWIVVCAIVVIAAIRFVTTL